MSDIKLKPCPFCGSDEVYDTSFFRNGAYEVHAECQECGALGPKKLIKNFRDPEHPAQDPTLCAAEAALDDWEKRSSCTTDALVPKRCPFCGSDLIDLRADDESAHVHCLNCKADGPEVARVFIGTVMMHRAIDEWNDRAGDADER